MTEELFQPADQDGQPLTIVVKPRQRTPQELRKIELSNAVGRSLKDSLASSTSLSQFILYHNATRAHLLASYAGGLDWMWQYGEPTFDEVLESFVNPDLAAEAEKGANAAEQLRPLLATLGDEATSIKMILKRVRGAHKLYKYAILAEFPKGTRADSPVLGFTPVEQTYTCPDILFFRPESPCVRHACDDLYKMHRQAPFYIPYRTRSEAVAMMQENEQGVNEYQLKKTTEEVVKQEAGNYILVGLQSAFSNELHVAPVSRYWSQKVE